MKSENRKQIATILSKYVNIVVGLQEISVIEAEVVIRKTGEECDENSLRVGDSREAVEVLFVVDGVVIEKYSPGTGTLKPDFSHWSLVKNGKLKSGDKVWIQIEMNASMSGSKPGDLYYTEIDDSWYSIFGEAMMVMYARIKVESGSLQLFPLNEDDVIFDHKIRKYGPKKNWC